MEFGSIEHLEKVHENDLKVRDLQAHISLLERVAPSARESVAFARALLVESEPDSLERDKYRGLAINVYNTLQYLLKEAGATDEAIAVRRELHNLMETYK